VPEHRQVGWWQPLSGDAVVVVAPDKFRGSLPASEAAGALSLGVRDFAPDAVTLQMPIADGGEGSMEACLRAGFRRVRTETVRPLGAAAPASYAVKDHVAVVELAEASGLRHAGPQRDVVMRGTTAGTGVLIHDALRNGARKVVLAVGGSATNDGGTGLAAQLGVRFLDAQGEQVPPAGASLHRIREVDLSAVEPMVLDANIVLATDVTSPLTGAAGAAHVFAAQKGATSDDIAELDAGLAALAASLHRATGIDTSSLPGAGAAGGVGACCVAALGATIVSGAEYLMDMLGVTQAVSEAHLVVTGEGSLDSQTLAGKAPAVLARVAADAGIPVLGVAGRISISPTQAVAAGFSAVASIEELELNPDVQMSNAAALLRRAAHLGMRRLAEAPP
jgi:glycerate kinase